MTVTSEMLSEHNLFRTHALEEARDQVARVFCPHRLVTTSSDGRLNAVHNRYVLSDLTLNYLDYGAEVLITPGELTSFFLMQIPLNGSAEIRCGSQEVHSTTRFASLASPTEFLDMQWHADTPQFLVHFDRTALEKALGEILGQKVTVPLRFDLCIDTSTVSFTRWRGLVEMLRQDAESTDRKMHVAVRKQLEDTVKCALITEFHNNYSDSLERFARPAVPRAIRRAMQICEESPEQSHTVTELARSVGVSVRSLQAGFRAHVGMTPTDYLRDVRLQRVHADLKSPSLEHASIGQIAFGWGFTHLGRFSHMYHARFGELPSQTSKS